jgi:hypothetical protein
MTSEIDSSIPDPVNTDDRADETTTTAAAAPPLEDTAVNIDEKRKRDLSTRDEPVLDNGTHNNRLFSRANVHASLHRDSN